MCRNRSGWLSIAVDAICPAIRDRLHILPDFRGKFSCYPAITYNRVWLGEALAHRGGEGGRQSVSGVSGGWHLAYPRPEVYGHSDYRPHFFAEVDLQRSCRWHGRVTLYRRRTSSTISSVEGWRNLDISFMMRSTSGLHMNFSGSLSTPSG